MTTHPNRGRIAIDPAGNWRIYTATLPQGAVPLGIVTRASGNGALVRIEATGIYVQVNAGAIRSLPQGKIRTALGLSKHGGAGRGQGRRADDGATELQRKQVKLDQQTIDAMTDIGDGNLSLGIREAARRLSGE